MNVNVVVLLMKSIFMRVLFCKFHCPSFICFCKPSAAAHLYTPGPLKLDTTPHILPLEREPPATDTTTNNTNTTSSDQLSSETTTVKDEKILDDVKLEKTSKNITLKSCIRYKKAASESGELGKKKVQWMDNIGKELADTREFESSEIWDIDYDEDSKGCVCVIL